MTASQKRGLSLAAGILGGLVLGPLAFLMFLVRAPDRTRCHYCQEWVHAAATVCTHCRKDISARAVWEAKRQTARR